MKIELHKIKISEVVKDYKDSAEEGGAPYPSISTQYNSEGV